MKKYILGISGGSGGLYSISVLKGIVNAGHKCYLVTSKPGRRILSLETDTKLSGNADKDKKILLRLISKLKTNKNFDDENLSKILKNEHLKSSFLEEFSL